MTAQTVQQSRFLGGRPPYGYRLADAGPHPNQAHAAWGRRCHRLAPDPVTAPHVRRMFAERLAGRSVAGIARALNERGVPCPSAADPERNRHRGGQVWNLRSVTVILANPRYTGHQVWSRQRSLPGAGRSTTAGEWAISRTPSHPALVSEAEFVAVQQASCHAEVQGRRHPQLCARRAGAVPVVRAADGLALGQRSRRIPLPLRSPERPGPTGGRGAQPLRPQGRAPGRPRHVPRL